MNRAYLDSLPEVRRKAVFCHDVKNEIYQQMGAYAQYI